MKEYLDYLKEMDNYTETENGAVALSSTLNPLLDAFGSLASKKGNPKDEILRIWQAAYQEEPAMAMRLLFYIRDIRGGQGMRRIFRVIAKNIALTNPKLMVKNLDNFLFFGRGDDVLCLLDTPAKAGVLKWISTTIMNDLKAVAEGKYPTLLAKWLPSINTSSHETAALGRTVAKGLSLSEKQYRKALSILRKKINVVETLMSQNRWDEIDFEKVPAKASIIYSDAFIKHVKENYISYLKNVAEGKAKVNAGSLFPVDIIDKIYQNDCKEGPFPIKDKYLLTAMWESLPNYFEGKEETGICVVDTSGSMMGTPFTVAVSLGLYCADKAKGPYKGHFITFSKKPKLQKIIGNTIDEKVHNLWDTDWDGNTDLEAVFDLILSTAINNKVKPEDIPSKLYIISDMQFDEARGQISSRLATVSNPLGIEMVPKPETFMQKMKKKYAEAGYILPAIVYWNVSSYTQGIFHDTFEGENCAFVSGYSASLFKSIIEGTEWVKEEIEDNGQVKIIVKQKLDPIEIMDKTLLNERYDRVITE